MLLCFLFLSVGMSVSLYFSLYVSYIYFYLSLCLYQRGASLITNRHFLTAAHCADISLNFTIFMICFLQSLCLTSCLCLYPSFSLPLFHSVCLALPLSLITKRHFLMAGHCARNKLFLLNLTCLCELMKIYFIKTEEQRKM